MKKIITWLGGLFKDEKGTPSSKRAMGIICTLTLCITMYSNSFTEEHFAPSETLVNSVALLAFGCLGLSTVDKFTKKKDSDSTPQ
jgi:hypothetical protein